MEIAKCDDADGDQGDGDFSERLPGVKYIFYMYLHVSKHFIFM